MRATILSGGVGGARLARGLARLTDVDTTVVVNVGDDDFIYGLDVSPDLDTVVYTLAELEGPAGWGRRDDTWNVMRILDGFPIDATFRIGDTDMAVNLFRTARLAQGWPLSRVTAAVASTLGARPTVIPSSDGRIRTRIKLTDGTWIGFQEYFVTRRHADEIIDVRFEGASVSSPAPGVIEAIDDADVLIIGPSNPPLSIWPILAIPDIGKSVARHDRVIAVSPLIGGAAVKGPAARVLSGLGLPDGNAGVLEAYDGLVTDFFIDESDRRDQPRLSSPSVRVHTAEIAIAQPSAAEGLARRIVDLA